MAIKSGTDSIVPTLVGYGQLVEEVNRLPWLKICIMIWSRESLALWGMLDAWHSDTGSLLIMYKLIRYELTNMLFMNNYIILLIMTEWFYLNALWKVKGLMKRRSFWWKEKLFFKDKCFWSFCYSLKIKFLTKVQVYVNIKMLSFITMKVIIFYEKTFMKKSFIIL